MRLVPVLAAAALALPTAGCRQLLGLHDLDRDAPAPASDATVDAAPPDGPLIPADAPGSGWWDTAWLYRIPLTITNGSSAALPRGFQVSMQAPVGGAPCRSAAPFPDARITFGTAELARVFDDQTSTLTATWFRLAEPLAAGATSTGEYWLYCGNSSATAPPGAEAMVFDFWEPFDTLDTNVWTFVGSDTLSAGSNFLLAGALNGSAVPSGAVSTAAFPYTNHAVDYVARTGFSSQTWWGGFQDGSADAPPWVEWYTTNTTVLETSYQTGTMIKNGAMLSHDTAQHIYSIDGFSDHAVFGRDDVKVTTMAFGADPAPPAALSLRLWNNSTAGQIEFHWIRTRQASDPPPAVLLGSAETLPP